MSAKNNMPEKRLFLVRHAQALNNSDSGDSGRSLSSKGKDDAVALGKTMQGNDYIPDVILCSPALRTRQTLEGVQCSIKQDNSHFIDILYNGSTGDYLYEIQKVSDAYNNILFIAHNPCIYELVILLAAQGDDSEFQRLGEGYSPASFSVISCKAENWKDIQPAENTIKVLLNPMDYNAPARPTRWM